MKHVVIHTDGACAGNPGPGGWAAVLSCGESNKELSGGAAATTNNRMELQAAIEALRALTEPCVVELFTDSEYLRQGITQWLRSWKARGWRTSTREPVKNEDLWRELDVEAQRHRITWQWVRGHAGHVDNERCDELARLQIQKIREAHPPAALAAQLADFRQRQAPPAAQLGLGV